MADLILCLLLLVVIGYFCFESNNFCGIIELVLVLDVVLIKIKFFFKECIIDVVDMICLEGEMKEAIVKE